MTKMRTNCKYNFPVVVFSFALVLSLFLATVSAQLRPDYYAKTCPNVESIVRAAVEKKVKETFVAISGVIRLVFHDCFIQGCDASIMIVSTPTNKAEKDHPDNLSLSGDGFDTVIQAKAALDKVPGCRNKVSCADILVMATRDIIKLAGGPSYGVELGRLDGLVSTADSVDGKLPKATFNLDQLTSLFAANGLTQTDMIALSGKANGDTEKRKEKGRREKGKKKKREREKEEERNGRRKNSSILDKRINGKSDLNQTVIQLEVLRET